KELCGAPRNRDVIGSRAGRHELHFLQVLEIERANRSRVDVQGVEQLAREIKRDPTLKMPWTLRLRLCSRPLLRSRARHAPILECEGMQILAATPRPPDAAGVLRGDQAEPALLDGLPINDLSLFEVDE